MSDKTKGIVSIVGATLTYGMYGVFSKMIGSSFGSFAVNYVRGIFVFLIVFLVFRVSIPSLVKVTKKNIPLFVVWIITATVPAVLTFVAFTNLGIGITYLLIYSTMILGGVGTGILVYKEKLTIYKAIGVLLALFGVVVVYWQPFDTGKLLYIVFALLAGLLVGMWNSLSKEVGKMYTSMQMVQISSVSVIIFSILGAVAFKENIPLSADLGKWFWVFIYACAQLIAMGLLIQGFKLIEASVASVIMPIEIVFGMAFGILFFGEALTIQNIIGGAIILTATIISSFEPEERLTE